MRSPDASGGDVDAPMEQMQNLRMDAPISDNSVSTTCGNSGGGGGDVALDWGVEGVSVDEEYSSDMMPPQAVAVGVGGVMHESRSAANVKSGKSSIKSRIKSSVRTATSWIPKVFGHKPSQVAVGGNQSDKQSVVRSSKKDMRSSLVRHGSTSSSVLSAYSSLAGSVSGSQTSTSYSTSSAALTAPHITRCASYEPLHHLSSSRRSSTSSITTSSEPRAKPVSQGKGHLSQTDNLIVQPQSVALSSAISSEGYGSSLSTLNSTSSLPFEAVRSDTGSGSNSTTMTVTTQIHHPNENVVLDECDSDQPIEFNHNLILPDDVMLYLKESSECKPEASTTSGETSLQAATQVPNLLPPGPLSPNSSVSQPSAVVLPALDSRLTNLSTFQQPVDMAGGFAAADSAVGKQQVAGSEPQPPPYPAGSRKEVTPGNKSFSTAANYYQSHPQTQQPAYHTHDLHLQQQQQHQRQQQFLRQQQSQWHPALHQQQQQQSFCPPNLFQVPNQIQMHSYSEYAARSQAMTGTSRCAQQGYSRHEAAGSSYNYMQSSGSRHQEPAVMQHHAAFNRSHNPSGPSNFVSPAHNYALTAAPHAASHRMDQFYGMSHYGTSNSSSTSSTPLSANMVVNDLNSTQAALIEETRFLKHHQQIAG